MPTYRPSRQAPVWSSKWRDTDIALTGRHVQSPAGRARAEIVRRVFLTSCHGWAVLEDVRQQCRTVRPDLFAHLGVESQKNIIRSVLSQIADRVTAW
jgi:hypothetical protein